MKLMSEEGHPRQQRQAKHTRVSTVLQENLVAKCKGLTASGMTCYHWCGGYAVPAPTATGSIQRDMCLIDSCLGVGEVAVSDHRSSVPSVNHLANIARYKQC